MWSKQRQKIVFFTRVSPLDPNPDPKYKPYLHMKNHHHRLVVIDLEAAKNSLEVYQSANVSVLCYDAVPSEFFKKIINLKDESERCGKKREGIVSQLRATSWHTTRQETIEPGQLTAIFGTAEIIKENKKAAKSTFQRSRLGTVFCRCGKKLNGLTAVQEKTAQVPTEKGCQIILSYDFDLPKKLDGATSTPNVLSLWAAARQNPNH